MQGFMQTGSIKECFLLIKSHRLESEATPELDILCYFFAIVQILRVECHNINQTIHIMRYFF
jgi:hypothetical protein